MMNGRYMVQVVVITARGGERYLFKCIISSAVYRPNSNLQNMLIWSVILHGQAKLTSGRLTDGHLQVIPGGRRYRKRYATFWAIYFDLILRVFFSLISLRQ